MADNYIAGKVGHVSTPFGGGTINPTTGALVQAVVVTGAASNGGPNLIRLTMTTTVGLTTGMTITVGGIVGTVEANGTWEITVISGTTLDLQGSAFVNNWVSGGNVSLTYSFDKWGLAINCHLPEITNFTSQGFQALLSSIFSGDISASGPYNRGNMPFTSGTLYIWELGFTANININTPGIIDKIDIKDVVSNSPRVELTAKSTGVFLASIA